MERYGKDDRERAVPRPTGPSAFGSATERNVHTKREEIREASWDMGEMM